MDPKASLQNPYGYQENPGTAQGSSPWRDFPTTGPQPLEPGAYFAFSGDQGVRGEGGGGVGGGDSNGHIRFHKGSKVHLEGVWE